MCKKCAEPSFYPHDPTYASHFSDEETEAQRGAVICPRPHSQELELARALRTTRLSKIPADVTSPNLHTSSDRDLSTHLRLIPFLNSSDY